MNENYAIENQGKKIKLSSSKDTFSMHTSTKAHIARREDFTSLLELLAVSDAIGECVSYEEDTAGVGKPREAHAAAAAAASLRVRGLLGGEVTIQRVDKKSSSSSSSASSSTAGGGGGGGGGKRAAKTSVSVNIDVVSSPDGKSAGGAAGGGGGGGLLSLKPEASLLNSLKPDPSLLAGLKPDPTILPSLKPVDKVS